MMKPLDGLIRTAPNMDTLYQYTAMKRVCMKDRYIMQEDNTMITCFNLIGKEFENLMQNAHVTEYLIHRSEVAYNENLGEYYYGCPEHTLYGDSWFYANNPEAW